MTAYRPTSRWKNFGMARLSSTARRSIGATAPRSTGIRNIGRFRRPTSVARGDRGSPIRFFFFPPPPPPPPSVVVRGTDLWPFQTRELWEDVNMKPRAGDWVEVRSKEEI